MVRFGIIGLGNMGSAHAKILRQLDRASLVAVADEDAKRLQAYSDLATFDDPLKLIESGLVDAVLIATPHYSHTTLGIAALSRGIHVLTEKPISVHKADAERLIAAWTPGKQVFGAMFNQRTDPAYQTIRTIVKGGELGEIRRTNWIISNWFRTEAYYSSGGWRATWAGEGGGVLLNQCPHNLDLFQWICGMPQKVRAFCQFGRDHNIEVEDEVTAYFEYPNRATGVFVTSTGEAPGTNRLEIAGDLGKLVFEGGKITVTKNEASAREFCKTSREAFAAPKTTVNEIVPEGKSGQHQAIIENFVAAILDGAELLAPAEEGIHSVELANAMLYSAWTDSNVELPLNSEAYERELGNKIQQSRFNKVVREDVSADLSKSFA
ncbi:MAG TPA: Gfo/Idh/MocA family oxidoreductase [Fimbriimonas sp.]|nr:Gfo/Idh/MocA family oxidoreductase [Fimbriimonas sp.]